MKVLVNELHLEYEVPGRGVRKPAAAKAAPPAMPSSKASAKSPLVVSDKNRGPGPSPLKFASMPIATDAYVITLIPVCTCVCRLVAHMLACVRIPLV